MGQEPSAPKQVNPPSTNLTLHCQLAIGNCILLRRYSNLLPLNRNPSGAVRARLATQELFATLEDLAAKLRGTAEEWLAVLDHLVPNIEAGRLPADKPSPLDSRLMGVNAAAIYMGKTPKAVRHIVAKRLVPAVRIGRRVMIDRRDLDKLIEKSKR